MARLHQILSGGQTGADRAALDWAIRRAVRHGGWCPKGRRAEDGMIPPRYLLRETPSPDYAQRTEWNVRDSDATVIFSIGARLGGGSLLTQQLAERLRKPVLHLSRTRDSRWAMAKLRAFLRRHRVRVLNVAGPRASQEPEVARFVAGTLAGIDPMGAIAAGARGETSSRKHSSPGKLQDSRPGRTVPAWRGDLPGRPPALGDGDRARPACSLKS